MYKNEPYKYYSLFSSKIIQVQKLGVNQVVKLKQKFIIFIITITIFITKAIVTTITFMAIITTVSIITTIAIITTVSTRVITTTITAIIITFINFITPNFTIIYL